MSTSDPSSERAGDNRAVWQRLYSESQKVNRYPHDSVVTFVMRNFGRAQNRAAVRLLDYGCGGGGNAAFLVREGYAVYAIDGSEAAARHAAMTVEVETRGEGRAQIAVAEFKHLPFADGFFDGVIDRQSLGQNPSVALPALVGEIKRVMKPGGLYFGINFSTGHPQLCFGRDLGGGDYDAFEKGVFKGIGMRHFFTEAEVRRLFAQFRIRDIRTLLQQSLLSRDEGSEEMIVIAARP
jgi:SAM-dependent methyltransferase